MKRERVLWILLVFLLTFSACSKPWEEIPEDPERSARREDKESLMASEAKVLEEKTSTLLPAVIEDNLYKLVDNLTYAINAKDFDFLLGIQVLGGREFKSHEVQALAERYSQINFLKASPVILDKTKSKAFLELELIADREALGFVEGKNKRYLYFSYDEKLSSWYLERLEDRPLSQESFYGKSLSFLRQTEFVLIKDQTFGREEYHFKGLLDIPGISSRNNRGVIVLNPAMRSLRLELQLITDVVDKDFLGPVYYCDFDLYTKEITEEKIIRETRLSCEAFNEEEFRIYEDYLLELSEELLKVCREKGQFEEESEEGFAVTFFIPDSETPWNFESESTSDKYPFSVQRYVQTSQKEKSND